VNSSERDELIAAVSRRFEEARRVYVASIAAGADDVDAAIGSALNDAEERVLDLLRGPQQTDPDGGQAA
jgi:hypothetical protein